MGRDWPGLGHVLSRAPIICIQEPGVLIGAEGLSEIAHLGASQSRPSIVG